jgi:hypothetical protein
MFGTFLMQIITSHLKDYRGDNNALTRKFHDPAFPEAMSDLIHNLENMQI